MAVVCHLLRAVHADAACDHGLSPRQQNSSHNARAEERIEHMAAGRRYDAGRHARMRCRPIVLYRTPAARFPRERPKAGRFIPCIRMVDPWALPPASCRATAPHVVPREGPAPTTCLPATGKVVHGITHQDHRATTSGESLFSRPGVIPGDELMDSSPVPAPSCQCGLGVKIFACGMKASRGCRACARHDTWGTAHGSIFSAPGVRPKPTGFQPAAGDRRTRCQGRTSTGPCATALSTMAVRIPGCAT